MLMPLRAASSIRFTHTTTLSDTSIVCKTRLRFLSSAVASHTTTTASGLPKQIKFLATSSSAECAIKEYVPGISTKTQPCFAVAQYPCAFATVLPGQFPVC